MSKLSRVVPVALMIGIAAVAAVAAPTQTNPLAADRAPQDQLLMAEWNYTAFSCIAPCALSPTFQFFTSAGTVLQVTDYQCIGDQYEVWDNGVLLGTTSTPTNLDDCATVANDGQAGWDNPNYSKASFVLGAGAHDVQLIVVSTPFANGAAALRIPAVGPIQAIPALSPAMLAGLALVLGGAAFFVLRRRARPAA